MYEVATFQTLREQLRCKEIWVVGADRWRNPDEDLPTDFESRRAEHYRELHARHRRCGPAITGRGMEDRTRRSGRDLPLPDRAHHAVREYSTHELGISPEAYEPHLDIDFSRLHDRPAEAA